MATRPNRTERGKTQRLACCNAEGVRGRKLELDHFLNQHGVDIYLLNETFLNPGQAFRLANYVCHCTDRPTARGGTAILVRRGIVHRSVPVPDLTHLEATAIQIMVAGKPFAFPPTDRSGPERLLWRRVVGLTEWRSDRQTCRLELSAELKKGKLLRGYADENCCMIFGPEKPTTNPYNPSATPDALDIVITRDLPSWVHLTSCSALRPDHFPVLIDIMCRSSFKHPPDRSDFRRTDWANF
jgi:hypothetical protein